MGWLRGADRTRRRGRTNYFTTDTPRLCLSSLLPEPAAAARFAIEFGCREILRAVFYELAKIDIRTEWDDALRDGDSRRAARLELRLLEKDDLIRLLKGEREVKMFFADDLINSDACNGGEFWYIAEGNCHPGQNPDWYPKPHELNRYSCWVILRRFFDHTFTKAPPVHNPLNALKDCIKWVESSEAKEGL